MKATNAQLEERIEFTIELLCQGDRQSEVKRKLCEKFGPLSPRTCADYSARARKALLESIDVTREEMIARSYSVYLSVIRDDAATLMDKIRAQERIDKLFGLEAPQRNELTGPNGKPIAIQHEVTPKIHPDVLRKIIALSDAHAAKALLDVVKAPELPESCVTGRDEEDAPLIPSAKPRFRHGLKP